MPGTARLDRWRHGRGRGRPKEAPCWPAVEVLPARNALVHLPSFADGKDAATPPSPRFFNAFALDYDFVPSAQEPAEWKEFLRQILEDDEDSIACLQEWFGYLLTPDTRQQKILMMVGPKRSGRGTIARVLKALAGPSNVVNPTLATLARPFGLAPLIDKPVAILPDARLSGRPDNAAITECLLSISGEDDQTVDRKHLPAWTGRLPTRFVLISNELPRLRDASRRPGEQADSAPIHPVVLRSGRRWAFRSPEPGTAGHLAVGNRRLETAAAPRLVRATPVGPRSPGRHGRPCQPDLRLPS